MTHAVNSSQVAAFRLARHHLARRDSKNPATVCRDVCGIQAQVMSAARLALWARVPGIERSAIDTALWKDREFVKTYAMRGTLHLLATDDFPVYISAMKASRTRQSLAVMARYGVTEKEAFEARDAAVQGLRFRPMPRRELSKQVLSQIKVGRKARLWFERASWGVFRLAIIEGLVCHGPNQGQEATVVRVSEWLPKQRNVSERDAQRILLRRYLSAYGPATLRDFSKWAGLSAPEGKAIGELLQDECVEVEVENEKALILRNDLKQLQSSALAEDAVRLLPNFDCFLLAHAVTDHLVHARHYKRVYRNQGWISPVVLRNGKVIGVWSTTRRGKLWTLEVEPFERFGKSVRAKVEEEAASLGRFLGSPCEVRFALANS